MKISRLVPYAVFAILVAGYASLNPLRLEHYAVLALMAGLALGTERTRDLLVSLVPLAIFGFVYDLMRIFEGATWETVTVEAVYRLEAQLFGWLPGAGGALGPVDFFREHNSIVLDAIGGAFYSFHIPPVVAFGLFLWWRTQKASSGDRADLRLHRYWWGFLAMCLFILAIHLYFPVAPPWFVEKHGFAPPGTPIPGDPAGLARLDTALDIRYFQDVYAKAPYVFGALPSLHAAFPVWLALHVRHRAGRVAAWGFAAAMSLFAVYLSHHYIVDVAAGVFVAAGFYALFKRTRLRSLPRKLHDLLYHTFFAAEPGNGSGGCSSDASPPPACTGGDEEPSNSAWDRAPWSLFAASFGGVGYLPLAPGTWGAVAALPLVVATATLPLGSRLALFATVTVLSVPVVERAGRALRAPDSPRIVLDEVVGVWATLIWLPSPSWATVALGFLAFRIFDIVKPPGARWFDERGTGGFDVVADDLVAALWALPIPMLAHAAF